MIGMGNLLAAKAPGPPELKENRALQVLQKIDELLRREREAKIQQDTWYVDLGHCLCEARAGQYWRVENLRSFDDYLETRFPGSRRKAYYLMAIHERLPQSIHGRLRGVGWSKALELTRVVRKDGAEFDSATWLHKAETLPKEEFKREVHKHIHGADAEPYELLYFKVYKSQLDVIEQALETAGMMLGSDRSRGYCLEMICADFLAGANLGGGDERALTHALGRTFQILNRSQQQEFLTLVSPEHRVKE